MASVAKVASMPDWSEVVQYRSSYSEAEWSFTSDPTMLGISELEESCQSEKVLPKKCTNMSRNIETVWI